MERKQVNLAAATAAMTVFRAALLGARLAPGIAAAVPRGPALGLVRRNGVRGLLCNSSQAWRRQYAAGADKPVDEPNEGKSPVTEEETAAESVATGDAEEFTFQAETKQLVPLCARAPSDALALILTSLLPACI